MAKKIIVRSEPNDLDKAIAKSLSSINGNMNFQGFTKRFVNNVEGEAEKGLTGKQREMAVLIMCKFRRQIPIFTLIVSQLSLEMKAVVAGYLKGKKV